MSLCLTSHLTVPLDPGACSVEQVLIEPHQFESEVPGRGKCKRLQLPLKLAWSITVHKSQGLSIEAVRMDLSRCRTPGQWRTRQWRAHMCPAAAAAAAAAAA
eukprot:COSAG03_NODE_3123_length_2198_cov_1.865174_3_plen_101_part_01